MPVFLPRPKNYASIILFMMEIYEDKKREKEMQRIRKNLRAERERKREK